MTQRSPPTWLAPFQARFSAMLRTPLDRQSGTLRDRSSAYGAEISAEALDGRALGARERLAAYNRQYWFRLFGVLQGEYPLTARLTGAWSFNALAAAFLEAQPPVDHDLARAADGFAEYLESALPDEGLLLLPKRALLQAARIDDAYRAVFRAPEQQAFMPSAADTARLPTSQLIWSGAARLVDEDWALVHERRKPRRGEQAVPLPEALAAPQRWLICRIADGTTTLPLPPLAATLLELLRALPLDRALVQLEQRAQPHERAALAAFTQHWLAESMRLALWTGMR